MKFYIYFLFILCPVLINNLSAQSALTKESDVREQLWLGYFNQTRFTNYFGIWADLHLRRTDEFAKQNFQFITHNGLTYYVSDNVRLTAGYTYSYLYAGDGLPGRPEHRPWQQIWWRQNYSWFQTLQWIRLEERFRQKVANAELVDGYNFNYRIRYNLSLFVPLKGKKMAAKTPFFALMDEVFINFGNQIVYNYFDNNRFFVGFGYQFTQHLNAQLGYMYLFQQEASGNKYVDSHAIRLYVFHSLDFRKKEEGKH